MKSDTRRYVMLDAEMRIINVRNFENITVMLRCCSHDCQEIVTVIKWPTV